MYKKKKRKKKEFPFVLNKVYGLTDWVPAINDHYNKIKSNSWFDISICENIPKDKLQKYIVETSHIPTNSYKQQMKQIRRRNLDKDPDFIYTKKVRLYPAPDQRIILQEWFDAATRMFNITVCYIRQMIYHHNKLIDLSSVYDIIYKTDFRFNLKEVRDLIIVAMKYPIPVHILDEVIQQVVSNHKTCLTNLMDGHIKKFRVRTQAYIRRRHTLKIESNFFSNGSFCKRTFPSFESSEPLVGITSTCTLLYDRDTQKYILLIPTTKEKEYRNAIVSDCGIDLGIRTFVTTYSGANVVSIGNNLYKKVKKYHRKIDKINELLSIKEKEVFVNKKIVVKKKIKAKGETKIVKQTKRYLVPKKINRRKLKRGLRKYHKKITDMVRDLHFKSANYLVNHYDNIYIGKLSTKSILSRNNKKITKRTKRMIGVLAPYLFRQRLAYMGNKYGSFVGEVDEYLTTKTCCNCGRINEIGSSKTHKCKCGMNADRDENSAKTHLKIGLANEKGNGAHG